MSEVKLEWASAEVKSGKLTVPVDGSAESEWRGSFERAVTLLHGGAGDWGEVKLSKKRVTVADVSPGAEDKLRHFLEGVVQQANADTGKAEDAEQSREDGKQGDEARDDGPDGEMTSRFRSFGDADQDEQRDAK